MSRTIITTSPRGLNTNILPYRLYQKAKRLGVWDPQSIDFSRDVEDWQTLTPEQRRSTLRLVSQFQAGEEAVTVDLLPLIMTIAQEGRLEEEMYLTTFLFEEAKHTEFFRVFLNTVGENGDLSEYHTPSYRRIFYEILPEAMNRLRHDQSPEAIADASTVYNMFVEGVLAETGYYSFYETLNKLGKMPGLMKGIGYLKQDESRHIGYASFLLQRLICEHPHLLERIENKLRNELMPLYAQLNEEIRAFGNPYGIDTEEVRNFSTKQMTNRLSVLARAKGKTIAEIYQTPESALGVLS